jgi:hypothetical protein
MRRPVSPLLQQHYWLRVVGIDRFGSGTPLAPTNSIAYTLTCGMSVPAPPWHLAPGEWLCFEPFANAVVLLRYQPEQVVTSRMHQLTF